MRSEARTSRTSRLTLQTVAQALEGDGPKTERFAERAIAHTVAMRLQGAGAPEGAADPVIAVLRRGAAAALKVSDASFGRAAMASGPSKLLFEAGGDEEFDQHRTIDPVTGKSWLDPTRLWAHSNAGATTAQRLDFVEAETMRRVDAPFLGTKGGQARRATMLGAEMLKQSIENTEVVLDIVPSFGEKRSRATQLDDFRSGAVTNANEQNRLMRVALGAGVPVPELYAISRAESGGSPTSFAYNLHVGAEDRTEEQEAEIRKQLAEAGLDPAERPDRKTNYYSDNNEAQRAFQIVYGVNRASAVKGAAWGLPGAHPR